ncbi:alpha-ketoglutarate-dependent dioxygenase AlkB [uncultured Enterovirga sp.]|uniref:alpha-ketoglutarate-dependent dioxygenase AlkB family protein n=1 Tax=uncultured Enterovirga sp. TaxID=2026352 RepID=UPI0035CA0ED3
MQRLELGPGLIHIPGYFDPAEQTGLRVELDAVMREAPPFQPRMPRTGAPFSIRMTNCGELGWVSDERGYRYQPEHPETGRPWPEMPDLLRRAWRDLSGYRQPAEACLVNLYGEGARMGLHQDRDEADFDAPVVSLSLGDTAVFRVGGTRRGGPTRSLRLASGDAFVFGGEARLVFHGIDRVLTGSSTVLPGGGRINCTLRRVTAPASGAGWRHASAAFLAPP